MRISYLLLRRQGSTDPSSSPASGADNSGNTTAATPTSTLSFPLGTTATPAATQSVSPSSASTSSSSGTPSTAVVAIVASIVGVLGLLILVWVLRRVRLRHKNPKYVPTQFLKKRWEKWNPEPARHRLPDTNEHLEPISTRDSRRPPSTFDAAAAGATDVANNTTSGGVDRNTSVRSVMTLPAYRPTPVESEQVLAREGERGGIDTVVEFPETADDEETRREEEMEALYQVRLARRRENEEREERRRLRREARERGDYAALRELQARARAPSNASGGRSVEELRREHARIKNERQRAVSSVSYAELGVARHDGTRLRANSQESERQGLLGDTASIAASSQYHRRERSTSSVVSIDTMNSDLPSPGLTRSRANSRPESPLRRVSTSSQNEGRADGRAGSSPEIIEHDDIPPNSPPGYENISLDTPQEERSQEPPPTYSSPVVGRGDGPTFNSNTDGRRSVNHVGQLMDHLAERRRSSGTSLPARTPTGERRTSRGIGGAPQLPSLRLATLPSIHVEAASPAVGPIDEDDHHPEE